MRHGDLFSGIGGFALAAAWMGWQTRFFSEVDPYAVRVLRKHWPDVPQLGDITQVDWATVPTVDVLTAGFPCQPHSLAGSRKGSEDERDLFSEIIRAAGVLRPRYLVLENVPGLFTSDGGRFFGRVLGSLTEIGYDAEWRVLSAADIGANHLRQRVWISAHAHSIQHESRPYAERWQGAQELLAHTAHNGTGRRQQFTSRSESAWDVADANEERREQVEQSVSTGTDGERSAGPHKYGSFASGRGWWATEPAVGRVADGVPNRVDRLKGLGNAIVPACAYEIFQGLT